MSFIVDDLVGVNNYALEKYTNQTSMAYLNNNGPPRLAVDGDLKTCSRTGKIVNEIYAPVTNGQKCPRMLLCGDLISICDSGANVKFNMTFRANNSS